MSKTSKKPLSLLITQGRTIESFEKKDGKFKLKESVKKVFARLKK